MTNQQAPEIYTLHTVPSEGKTPWFGIYALRADAEHDAKVMRDATGRDWSVVRLVVADTAATPPGSITRYEVVDCIDSKHVPAVIPNGAGPWVRYEDHIAALVEAQQQAVPQADSQPAPVREEEREAFKAAPIEPTANDIHGALTAAAIYLANAQRQYEKKMHRQAIASLQKAQRAIAQAAGFAKANPPAQAADSVLEDAARLDWLALAGPTSICLVIDRPHDGEVEVATDDVTGYGKTLREAIDAAMNKGGA